jgi:hypothetical protein
MFSRVLERKYLSYSIGRFIAAFDFARVALSRPAITRTCGALRTLYTGTLKLRPPANLRK